MWTMSLIEIAIFVALVTVAIALTLARPSRPRRVDVIFRARLANGSSPDAIRPVSVEIVEARWFPGEELPELQHETAGALVALARARRPVSQNGEPER